MSGQIQLHRERNGWRNNEAVVDLRRWVAGLPAGVAGFFYMQGTSEHDKQTLRRAHGAFLRQYAFPNQRGVPLMSLDLKGGGEQPFTLVPAEHDWKAGEG